MNLRTLLRLAWHTRPFHSPGLVITRRGLYCMRCGADLSRDRQGRPY